MVASSACSGRPYAQPGMVWIGSSGRMVRGGVPAARRPFTSHGVGPRLRRFIPPFSRNHVVHHGAVLSNASGTSLMRIRTALRRPAMRFRSSAKAASGNEEPSCSSSAIRSARCSRTAVRSTGSLIAGSSISGAPADDARLEGGRKPGRDECLFQIRSQR